MFVRVKGRQVIEENLVVGCIGMLKVYSFNLDQGKVTLALLGRADLTGYSITGLQIELPDLRRGDIDIIRSRQVVVIRRTEKSESLRQAFQNSF